MFVFIADKVTLLSFVHAQTSSTPPCSPPLREFLQDTGRHFTSGGGLRGYSNRPNAQGTGGLEAKHNKRYVNVNVNVSSRP